MFSDERVRFSNELEGKTPLKAGSCNSQLAMKRFHVRLILNT